MNSPSILIKILVVFFSDQNGHGEGNYQAMILEKWKFFKYHGS